MTRLGTVRCSPALAALLFLTACCLLPAQTPFRSASLSPPTELEPQHIQPPGTNLYPAFPSQQDSNFGLPPPDWNDPAPGVSGPAQTVSAEALRHPLTKKGRNLLAKAQKDSRSGDHAKAIRELNTALAERSAEPYAHSMLGVEFLKLHQAAAAIRELVQAAKQLPRLSVVHSNLGLALCETGRIQQGLQEIDTALNLDQGAVKTHFLKGVILLDQGRADHETWSNLALAQRELPTARLALAIYYARQGQTNAAQQQLQNFTESSIGVTLSQARDWLDYAMSGVHPAEALGLWGHTPAVTP